MSNSNASGSSSNSQQEFSIRVPKNVNKKFHVMRFNADLNIDFTKWSQIKMERENNMKEYKLQSDDMPKFGAGSEYGREAKEEARRKKYGIITKKYRPEDQPWILKCGGKTGKKFKGIRGGGVKDNAAYYVFTHGADGGIEAYPIDEWYFFNPIQRYKSLSAEEAEQEFGRRNKVMNYFSLMLKKRLKNDEDVEGEEGDEGKPKKGKKKASGDFKISEMDEWLESGDDDSDADEEEGEAKEKKPAKAKAKAKPKKRKKGSDESASEESDDGDEEGREVDYISDSSESESDSELKVVKDLKGVAEESALRGLLTSEEEDEEEENKDKKEENKEGENKDKEDKSKKRKRTKTKDDKKDDDSSSDSSGDSSDSDAEKSKSQTNGTTAGDSAATEKKDDKTVPASKKAKLDIPTTPLGLSGGGDTGITEEAVRRYLMRKPMTTTELLQKFKSRKTSMSSEQLVNVMTQILKRINPTKQTVKGKMYLSIKPQQQ